MSPNQTVSRPDSIGLLKRHLKTWEGLHNRTLPPDALDAWIKTFQNIKYGVLDRALQIVTANAERFPTPGMLTRAIDLAREEARSNERPTASEPMPPPPTPAEREEFKRISKELRVKLGLPDGTYEPLTDAQVEEERQRQHKALEEVAGAPWAKRAPMSGRPAPDAGAATPAPATPTPQEGTDKP